jgi:cell division protein FtsQ
VSEAELYFDNNNKLHVTITEKEPVARVFTTGERSFYIDSAGRQMPLSEKRSARVPVFTGFPDRKNWNAKDSILVNEIRNIAVFIMNDPFWMAQVAQVDITKEKRFEMVPVVGSHIVKLGNGEMIGAKFNRLMVFYRQVLSKTGFDRYKLIDVQYKGQVVASRYAGDPKVDSIQFKRNVEKLLKYSQESALDTVIRVRPVTRLERDSVEISAEPGTLPKEENRKGAEKINGKKPGKLTPEKRTPKAVMPKREPVEDENGGY